MGAAASESGFTGDEKFLYMLMYVPGNTLEFNEKLPGSTWLQKQVFLLKTVVPEIEFEFDEHHYGAFCRALDNLRKKSLESEKIIQPDRGRGPLWLSEKGMKIGKELWNNADESAQIHISNVKKFMNDMSFNELVAYSYSTFPETAVNSDSLELFEKTRIEAARLMFVKKKATLKKASRIAGMSLDDFVMILEGHGIPAYVATVASFRRSMKELGRTNGSHPGGFKNRQNARN